MVEKSPTWRSGSYRNHTLSEHRCPFRPSSSPTPFRSWAPSLATAPRRRRDPRGAAIGSTSPSTVTNSNVARHRADARPGHFPDTPSASRRPHAVSDFSCLGGLDAPDGRRAVPSWRRHSCRPRPSRLSRRPWPLAAQRPGRHLPATDRRTGQGARPRPAGNRPRSGLSWTVISPVRLPLPMLPVRVPRPSLRSGYCNRGPHL